MNKVVSMIFSGFVLFSMACAPGEDQGEQSANRQDEEYRIGEEEHKEGAGHHDEVHANEHMNKSTFEDLIHRFEDPEREAWQKPDEVIAKMGNLKGKTVADIGAGTGYFAFRIAEKAQKVIAVDIDERFVSYVRERRINSGEGQNVEERLGKADDPLLKENEADHILIVDTYHHINDRIDYFSHLQKAMTGAGALWIVDFRKMDAPHGPPIEMKMSWNQVRSELLEAGYTGLEVDTITLPYQYIVSAQKP